MAFKQRLKDSQHFFQAQKAQNKSKGFEIWIQEITVTYLGHIVLQKDT